MFDDEALLARLKAGAVKKAESFEVMVQAKKMVAVYEQAIEDKKAGRYMQVDRDLLKAKLQEHRNAK